MARSPVRDERQGDLFGLSPLPSKADRRATAPKRAIAEPRARETRSLATLGQTTTRSELDELLDSLPDQELAYLAVEAMRTVKRRLAHGPGRGLRPGGAARGKSPLEDALRRIGGELMEFEDPGETW